MSPHHKRLCPLGCGMTSGAAAVAGGGMGAGVGAGWTPSGDGPGSGVPPLPAWAESGAVGVEPTAAAKGTALPAKANGPLRPETERVT